MCSGAGAEPRSRSSKCLSLTRRADEALPSGCCSWGSDGGGAHVHLAKPSLSLCGPGTLPGPQLSGLRPETRPTLRGSPGDHQGHSGDTPPPPPLAGRAQPPGPGRNAPENGCGFEDDLIFSAVRWVVFLAIWAAHRRCRRPRFSSPRDSPRGQREQVRPLWPGGLGPHVALPKTFHSIL